MRDRADFIENLKEAYTHLMILREDIRYPLSEERQKWLDGAELLVRVLYNAELKDDIEKALNELCEKEEKQ